MGFTIDFYNGYEKGVRYEKYLKFVNMYGNSNTRYIVMIDEDGNELHWTTNDYTKTYNNFKVKGMYKFTVDSIIDHDKQINIKRLTIVE